MTSICHLCVVYEILGPTQIKFHGYATYSELPWHLTGSVNSKRQTAVVFQSEGADYALAFKSLCEQVGYMASLAPSSWWAQAWPWINPSREAHEARARMIEEILK